MFEPPRRTLLSLDETTTFVGNVTSRWQRPPARRATLERRATLIRRPVLKKRFGFSRPASIHVRRGRAVIVWPKISKRTMSCPPKARRDKGRAASRTKLQPGWALGAFAATLDPLSDLFEQPTVLQAGPQAACPPPPRRAKSRQKGRRGTHRTVSHAPSLLHRFSIELVKSQGS